MSLQGADAGSKPCWNAISATMPLAFSISASSWRKVICRVCDGGKYLSRTHRCRSHGSASRNWRGDLRRETAAAKATTESYYGRRLNATVLQRSHSIQQSHSHRLRLARHFPGVHSPGRRPEQRRS